MAWTAPATAVAGDTLTAAFWNAQVRDNLNAIAAAGITDWATYTPTWTSSGTAPTNAATESGKYTQLGKLVIAHFTLDTDGSTTFGTGNYRWALPVTADESAVPAVGSARIEDSGTGFLLGIAEIDSTTTCLIRETAAGAEVGATAPMTWASGDRIDVHLAYEAA